MALTNVDVVFHQAAYGGYMPEMAKYVELILPGDAQAIFETDQEERFMRAILKLLKESG